MLPTESPAPQMSDGSVIAGGSQTDSQLVSSNTPVPVTTRSGRIVKRPAYLQDLVIEANSEYFLHLYLLELKYYMLF